MLLVLAVSALLAAAARPVAATSVVLGSDGELADQAPVVVEATVLAAVPSVPALAGAAPTAPTTDYLLRVERVLKGTVPAGTGPVRLRVLGGPGPDGMTLKVWGSPELRAGERALLFLVGPGVDGSYRPLHLAVGVFHQVEAAPAAGPSRRSGGLLAVRDLSEMTLVDAGGGGSPGTVQVRDYARFAQWLADRAGGEERSPDYQLQLPAADLRQVQEKFNYLGGIKQRWNQFDAGIAVHWTVYQAGQPGLADLGFNEFQVAMNAWNTNQGTNIKYEYDGPGNFTGGFQHPDGHNTLLPGDPNDDLPGSFTCSSPGNGNGILGAGGTWFPTNAVPPLPIVEADIVIQDGAGCWFNNDPARAQQVFAHELGHSLGMGHSCGDSLTGSCNTAAKDDALMRAMAHNDNRGAALGDDDRAGIATLYGTGTGGGTGSPPPAPSKLAAAARSASAIALTWRDNSRNATQIDVESKRGGGRFRQIQSLPGGATSAMVTGLAAGATYTFRVRAHNGSGFSGYSNAATAATQAKPAPTGGAISEPKAAAAPPTR
ncbi:MAG TPA: fibronectin type III domain-containing protein [Thermoanaerobaculia bacterium]|nr:fibronectin type III domain-containing protein [Thermoanaerobaculia bacterium]